jgi:hypothetical protein
MKNINLFFLGFLGVILFVVPAVFTYLDLVPGPLTQASDAAIVDVADVTTTSSVGYTIEILEDEITVETQE